MPNRITHFEIHSSDPQRSAAFYSELFGWEIAQWGDQPYWLINTGNEGPGINGGLLPRRGDSPLSGQAVNAYVCTANVESVDHSVEKAVSLGGAIALPKMGIPKVGWLAYIADPDGNIFGMMQNDPEAK